MSEDKDKIIADINKLEAHAQKRSTGMLVPEPPPVKKEHWIYLEEFCYVCHTRKMYIFTTLPVNRFVTLCCPRCKSRFDGQKQFFIDQHNLFMKYLREEELKAPRGAEERAFERLFGDADAKN